MEEAVKIDDLDLGEYQVNLDVMSANCKWTFAWPELTFNVNNSVVADDLTRLLKVHNAKD